MRKLASVTLVLVIALFVISPWLCGLVLQKKYHQFVQEFNETNQSIQVTVTHYARHWFFSDATLIVTVESLPKTLPDVATLFQSTTTSRYQFVIQQHLIHGPYIFHTPAKSPTHIALALIENTVIPAPQTALLLHENEMPDFFAGENFSLMFFNGNYFTYFKLNKMHLSLNVMSGTGSMTWGGGEGKVWLDRDLQNVSGDLHLHDVMIRDADSALSMTQLDLQLNQHKSHYGIWLGEDRVVLPAFILHLSNDNTVSIYGVDLRGDSNELTGQLNGSSNLSIEKILFANQKLGPVHIRLSESKLNVKTMQTMWATYRDILQNGEMYESQLHYKLAFLLPLIISPGTSVRVDQCDIGSPHGNLHMKGVLSWPAKNFMRPDNVDEMVQAANLAMKLQVAKPLVNDAINYMSGMSDFIGNAAVQDRSALLSLRDQLEFSVRQNVFLIADFERDQIISTQAADKLLDLQDKFVSMEDYSAELSRLFWAKDITLAASYWLNWQYYQVQKPYQTLLNKVDVYQVVVKKQLQQQIKKFIAERYLILQDDSYVVLINWANGQLKINGVVAQ